MDKIEEIKKGSKSYLSFQISNELYAVHVAYVNNIIEVPKITSLPNTPDYLKGVVNLRGMVLPVIDTCVKFRMPQIEFTTTTCVLVLDVKTGEDIIPVGALVDNVHAVIEINKDEIKPPPEIQGLEKSENPVEGMYNYDEKFIMILDVCKLFNLEYIENIKQHIEAVQQD